MGLLYRSMLRHLKRHAVQTVLTLAVTALFTGLLSAMFFFASGFGAMLRENALAKVGEYHYCYYVPSESGSRAVLEWMAEELPENRWFSQVVLTEEGEELRLYLTVAAPGIFMSRRMDKIFTAFVQRYYAETKDMLTMGHADNLDLLVSCGDLNRESGIYSLMAVFFLAFALIAVMSVLTLAAVYGVSAAQREKEFALLAGIGAEGRQLKGLVLAESVFYIAAGIPAGLLLGAALFQAGKGTIDRILYAVGYPPVRLALSLPFGLALACSAAGVILLSGLLPARKAAVVSPMRLLAGEEMYKLERFTAKSRHPRRKFGVERNYDSEEGWAGRRLCPGGQGGDCAVGRPCPEAQGGDCAGGRPCPGAQGGNCPGEGDRQPRRGARVEAWLAYKSWRRFRRRYRPVLLALSATFALCFVPGGVETYFSQVLEMAGEGFDYNISVELHGESLEKVDELARGIVASTGGQLAAVRKARFHLQTSLPLSEEAETSGFLTGGMLPDILLVSPGEELWAEICRDNPAMSAPAEGVRGIFAIGNRKWQDPDGILHRGEPFAVKEGDVIPVYGSGDVPGQAAFEILIGGVARNVPLFLDTEPGSRAIVLVSEDTFLQVEAQQLYMDGEPGLHHVSLRGMCADAGETERISRECIGGQQQVEGFVVNHEESLRRQETVGAGLQFLCAAFIVLLSAAAVCGDFTVSWAVQMSRKGEYAVLSSIGMKPEEIQKMRCWELLFQGAFAVLAGIPAGILCHYAVLRVYSVEYRLDWRFPWQGVGMGLALLGLQILVVEIVLRAQKAHGDTRTPDRPRD
nr:ABC transporter permease [uncultured Acetatifactor sp.]